MIFERANQIDKVKERECDGSLDACHLTGFKRSNYLSYSRVFEFYNTHKSVLKEEKRREKTGTKKYYTLLKQYKHERITCI
jgi:hypothetical protein